MNFMSDQNFSIFSSITGRASKGTRIEYVHGAPPSFTVVLQRVSNEMSLLPWKTPSYRAPVQGLRALLAVSGWARRHLALVDSDFVSCESSGFASRRKI